MKLYEINELIREISRQIMDYASENEGEVAQSLINQLNDLKISKDEKLLNIGILIKEKKIEIEGLREEEKSLYSRRKSMENHIDSLRNYISSNLNPGETIDSNRCKISWRKSQICVIDCADDIPLEFIKTTSMVMLDKIKNSIKDGNVINGAHLEEKNNLQIK